MRALVDRGRAAGERRTVGPLEGPGARAREGWAANPCGSYTKWQGGHWVLAALADLGYPAGDKDLFPLRDQLLREQPAAGRRLADRARYYEGFGTEARQSFDHVDWGGVDNHRANDSVTADALAVLAAAGRPS